MNIIFLGSSDFAVPSLKAILTCGYRISCVVTQPDRLKGRGLHLAGTAIKAIALEKGLKIYQPLKINTPEAVKFLKSLKPDLFVVISYGQILSQDILDIPKFFSINIHASLLPKYRGAAPINWALINGETDTGVTAIKMLRQMDAGPIILQKKTEITDEDTALSLENKLSHLAAQSLLDSLVAITDKNYALIPQDKNMVSFAPKLKKEDGLIDWGKSARQIYNLVRGSLDWPGAFTYYRGKLLKIYGAKSVRAPLPVRQAGESQSVKVPGEIIQVSKDGIIVATGGDDLIIKELQIEGKRRMEAGEFIAGHKISTGEVLGKK